MLSACPLPWGHHTETERHFELCVNDPHSWSKVFRKLVQFAIPSR